MNYAVLHRELDPTFVKPNLVPFDAQAAKKITATRVFDVIRSSLYLRNRDAYQKRSVLIVCRPRENREYCKATSESRLARLPFTSPNQ